MLMPSFVAAIAISAINEEINKQKAFKLKCSLLSDSEVEILKRERMKEKEREKQHSRNLEIANAGRARNFWGD